MWRVTFYDTKGRAVCYYTTFTKRDAESYMNNATRATNVHAELREVQTIEATQYSRAYN